MLTGDAVIAFPGAGSFGGEFRPLLAGLGPTARQVRYPGRVGRDLGTPAGSFDEVVTRCLAQIDRQGARRPVLIGHSYGAYVAYATAARLPGVAALVVVGAVAPRLHTVADVTTWTRADTEAYLTAVDPGAIPADTDDDWRDIVLDTTRDDLLLLAGFRPDDVHRLRCPVLAARGVDDPLTSADGVAAWAPTTDGPFSHEVFPGGHSDPLRSPALLTRLREVPGP